jgi:hypothetical protein
VNPLPWIADAIGGVVHAHLTSSDEDGWFDQLRASTGLIVDIAAQRHRRPLERRQAQLPS